jgi:hypothetical protein
MPPDPATGPSDITVRVVSPIRACDDVSMPLSEDEQRILRQIEEQLQNDPKFAQAVSPSGLYRHSARTLRWAVLGAVVGLVLLIALLQVHFLLAFVGFLVMLVSAVVIEGQVRAMGRAGIQDVASAVRNARSSVQRQRESD